jgi:hypothetical protein
MKLASRLAVFLAALALVSCGGGGTNSSLPTTPPPVPPPPQGVFTLPGAATSADVQQIWPSRSPRRRRATCRW